MDVTPSETYVHTVPNVHFRTDLTLRIIKVRAKEEIAQEGCAKDPNHHHGDGHHSKQTAQDLFQFLML